MGGFEQFLPIIIMFVIFYFLLIRPNQKRQKERTAMLGNLKKGDKVVTIGGMHGTIQEINDSTISLKVAHNTYVTFDRAAINSVATGADALTVDKSEAKATDAQPEEAK